MNRESLVLTKHAGVTEEIIIMNSSNRRRGRCCCDSKGTTMKTNILRRRRLRRGGGMALMISAAACAVSSAGADVSALGIVDDVLTVRRDEGSSNEKSSIIDEEANMTRSNMTRSNMTIDEISNKTIDATSNKTIDATSNKTIDEIPNGTMDETSNNTVDVVNVFGVNNSDSLLSPSSSSSGSEDSPTKAALNTLAEITSNLLLFLLIFGMSATVDMKNLLRQLNNRYAILTGITMQFVFMPLLGFLAVLALRDHGLTASMGLTLLIVTSSPGGSYSNWWCSMFNADLALSVTMTALSTLLSSFLLPANLALYGHLAYGFGSGVGEKEEVVEGEEHLTNGDDVLKNVDFKTLFISLGVVISAIFAGLYASYKIRSRKFQRWSNRLGSISGMLLILFSVMLSTFTGGSGSEDVESEQSSTSTRIWRQHWSFYVGVMLPCVVGLVLANLFSRAAMLSKPECVTVSVECCYQNVGIATSAAVAMFDDPAERAQALGVPIFYGLVEAVLLGLYCVWAWKAGWTKAPSDERLCVVISKTYEVDDDQVPIMDASPHSTNNHRQRTSFSHDNDIHHDPAAPGIGPNGAMRVRTTSDGSLTSFPQTGTASPLASSLGVPNSQNATSAFSPYPIRRSRSRSSTLDSFPENVEEVDVDADAEVNVSTDTTKTNNSALAPIIILFSRPWRRRKSNDDHNNNNTNNQTTTSTTSFFNWRNRTNSKEVEDIEMVLSGDDNKNNNSNNHSSDIASNSPSSSSAAACSSSPPELNKQQQHEQQCGNRNRMYSTDQTVATATTAETDTGSTSPLSAVGHAAAAPAPAPGGVGGGSAFPYGGPGTFVHGITATTTTHFGSPPSPPSLLHTADTPRASGGVMHRKVPTATSLYPMDDTAHDDSSVTKSRSIATGSFVTALSDSSEDNDGEGGGGGMEACIIPSPAHQRDLDDVGSDIHDDDDDDNRRKGIISI